MPPLKSIPTVNNTKVWIRWLVVIAVMIAAIIEVLDITIVNVALSRMMGSFGATQDEIAWVVTSYIVSAAIVMPLTGLLVDLLGRKRLLLISIIGFTITSVLCGLSQSLFQIVTARVLQGVFGASLIPLSQYILIDTFPPEEQSKAMAVWGTGVMSGPILGPMVGGYITDALSWHWIFFINVPVGIIAFLLAVRVITETPTRKRVIDWIELVWFIIGIGCLQIFLDRGQIDDWFESSHITLLALIAIFAIIMFSVRSLKNGNSVINLRLFKDYHFTMCSIMITIFSMGLFGLIVLQPLMLQTLMNYPAKTAGLVMAPREITTAIGMALVAAFANKIDPRVFVIAGFLFSGWSSYLMSQLDLTASFSSMVLLVLIQGVGTGLFFVPLATLGFSTLSGKQHAEASGVFNFFRNLGTSIGVSLINTYFSWQSQIHWNHLSGFLNPTNIDFQNSLDRFNWSLHDPPAMIYYIGQLSKQSHVLAFINAYWLIAIGFLVCIPLVFFLKKPKSVTLMFWQE